MLHEIAFGADLSSTVLSIKAAVAHLCANVVWQGLQTDYTTHALLRHFAISARYDSNALLLLRTWATYSKAIRAKSSCSFLLLLESLRRSFQLPPLFYVANAESYSYTGLGSLRATTRPFPNKAEM